MQTAAEHCYSELDNILTKHVQVDKEWPFIEKSLQVREPVYLVSAQIRLSAKGWLLARTGGWWEQK